MRLDCWLLADHAVAAPDGKLYINGGGITRLAVPTVPGAIPFLSIVVRFVVDANDFGDHTFALRLENPQGEHLLPPDPQPVPVKPMESAVEDEEVALQLVVGFAGLPIATLGTHRLTMELDGELVREMKLPAVLAEPPTHPPA